MVINKIKIVWQRLVSGKEDKTCPRCGSTEQELGVAVNKLGAMGYKVELKKKTISLNSFKKAPGESNKITINGKPMEYWISAQTASSPCCSVCGDSECRTVEVNDKSYETIPADLIIGAAKKAADNS